MNKESRAVVNIGGHLYERKVVRHDAQHERISYDHVTQNDRPVVRISVVGFGFIVGVYEIIKTFMGRIA